MARFAAGLIPHSLHARLAGSLIAAILIVAAVAGYFSYRSAFDEAIELQDDQLRAVAVLASQFHASRATPRAETDAPDTRIVLGRVGSGGTGLPPELAGLSPDLAPGFHSKIVEGEDEWRIFVALDGDGSRLVVAQRSLERDEIAGDGALRTLVPLMILVPVLLLVVGDIVRRSVAPLRALAAEVDARDEQDVARIAEGPLPTEVRPLIAAINRLLDRVEGSMAAQWRFVADAAHELRTPLTALSLQAERLESADMSGEARTRLGALRDGIRRNRALLEQLLLLARAQHVGDGTAASTPAGPVLRELVEQVLPIATAKSIDLGIEGDVEAAIPLAPHQLSALVRNLVDNALRHTPEGGRVDIRVETGPDQVTLEVSDTGPGIPADQRAIVFEPFHRLSPEQDGSGLGLAIVKAIADRVGATIAISDRQPGMVVRIRFRRPRP